MRILRFKIMTPILFILSLLVSTSIFAEGKAKSDTDHAIFIPTSIKWVKAPEILPKGAQIAVLEGDPNKAGSFTMRLKLPANYRISPHWHSIMEHVTVLVGTLYLGMGDKFDKKQAVALPAGTFAYMQPNMHHFAFTKAPTIIQLQDIGPWDITYVNPQDDPSKKNKA